MSLLPFATAWIGENYKASAPVTFYGVILFMSGIAFYILLKEILKHHGKDSKIQSAVGKSIKDKLSLAIYFVGIVLSFYSSILAIFCYIIVTVIWVIPDKRIEKII